MNMKSWSVIDDYYSWLTKLQAWYRRYMDSVPIYISTNSSYTYVSNK